ncbi:MAG: hypothetical protein ABIE84_06620, partial [bacterium]
MKGVRKTGSAFTQSPYTRPLPQLERQRESTTPVRTLEVRARQATANGCFEAALEHWQAVFQIHERTGQAKMLAFAKREAAGA